MNIIAITACPTGVAHTYLAESNLKKAAKKLGLNVLVETQGAIESEYILSDDDIHQADVVLIAADKKVEMARFQHKNVIEVPVTRAAKDAEGLLSAIVNGELAPKLVESASPTGATKPASAVREASASRSWASEIYVHLITGVNLMIPFVVAGGILIALSFSFGITAATPGDAHFSPIAKMLSGYMNKRDPNQGTCTNACRWEYKVEEGKQDEVGNIVEVQQVTPTLGLGQPTDKVFLLEEKMKPGEVMSAFEDEHGTYIMNSKDLRAVAHVERLSEMGVHSLKIEGRTKSFYYCARTAQVYRRAIDDAVAGKPFDPELLVTLEGLAHRGYTEGFLRRHTHDSIFSPQGTHNDAYGRANDAAQNRTTELSNRSEYSTAACTSTDRDTGCQTFDKAPDSPFKRPFNGRDKFTTAYGFNFTQS